MTNDVGTMYATYSDPDGVVWQLSNTDPDLGYFTRRTIAGWGTTTYEIVADPLARGGESVRFIRAQPARITWPLHVYGETHMEFVTRYRQLRRAFLMTVHRRTAGTLTVARPDGSSRSIEVFYEDGWGGEPGENWLFANPTLTLYAPDGYWRDSESTVESRFFTESVPFLDPYPTVSSSQILGDTVIVNAGEVLAWPTWTLTGPATQVTATNNTTGDAFTLTYALAAAETLTITTMRPTVRDALGVNRISALNWPSAVLWPLLPGDNDIQFTVAGSSAGTTIDLTYYARYEGA